MEEKERGRGGVGGGGWGWRGGGTDECDRKSALPVEPNGILWWLMSLSFLFREDPENQVIRLCVQN